MTFLPKGTNHTDSHLNLAPLIDFIFLLLVVFATLAVSRITARETQVQLVKLQEEPTSPSSKTAEHLIFITISSNGQYKWNTQIRDYEMTDSEMIRKELQLQYQKGLIPKEKNLTKVLLRIDKQAPWESILSLIFSIRQEGFDVKPIYTPASKNPEEI